MAHKSQPHPCGVNMAGLLRSGPLFQQQQAQGRHCLLFLQPCDALTKSHWPAWNVSSMQNVPHSATNKGIETALCSSDDDDGRAAYQGIGLHEPHPAGSRLLEAALEDVSTSESSLSLDLPSRGRSAGFNEPHDTGMSALQMCATDQACYGLQRCDGHTTSTTMDGSFCSSFQYSPRAPARPVHCAEPSSMDPLQPNNAGHVWSNTVLGLFQQEPPEWPVAPASCREHIHRHIEPAIASQQWIDSAALQQGSHIHTEPFSRPTRPALANEQSLSDDEDDSGADLQQTGGLHQRQPRHSGLGALPTSQAQRPANPGRLAGVSSRDPSGVDSDTLWQSLSCNGSGLDAFHGPHLRPSPLGHQRGEGLLDQGDQDEGVYQSPSPLRRHPWALNMGVRRWPTRRQARQHQLHGSTSLPDNPAAAPGEEPLHDSSRSLLPSWLHEASNQVSRRPHGAAVRSEASDQHSWRPSPGKPSGPDSQEQWSPGPSALDHADMDPRMQPEAASEGSVPAGSKPGAAAVRGGPGSGGSAEDDPQEPQDFHSLAHIPRFARLASRTVDRIAAQQPIQHPTAMPNTGAQVSQQAAPDHAPRHDGHPHLGGFQTDAQWPHWDRSRPQAQRVQQHENSGACGLAAAQDPGQGAQLDAAPANGRHQTSAEAGPGPALLSQRGAARTGRGRGRGSRTVGKGRSTMTKRAAAPEAFGQFVCGP